MSVEVDSSTLAGNFVTLLSQKLGRKVAVHRSESAFKKPGSHRLTKITKYSLYIEGSQPELYFGMTINEVKARMSLLLDLVYSGVFIPIAADGSPRPVSGRRPGYILPYGLDALGDTPSPTVDSDEAY